VVPALDLRRCLDLPESSAATAHIVVRGETGPVSLLVDEVGEVIAIPVAEVQPVPAGMPASVRSVLDGAHQRDGRLLLLLEVTSALRRALGAPGDPVPAEADPGARGGMEGPGGVARAAASGLPGPPDARRSPP
jgi:hypothetical protein